VITLRHTTFDKGTLIFFVTGLDLESMVRESPSGRAGRATDQYTDNDGVSLHKKDVRNEGDPKVGGPEADFRKARVEGVVMRPPSSPHGQELDDGHRDSR